MTLALLFDESSITSLQLDPLMLRHRRMDLSYVSVAASASNLKALEQLQVPFVRCEDSLLIVGQPALDYAELLQEPVQTLLPGGQVPLNDPPARQLLVYVLEALLPAAQGGPDVCCLRSDHPQNRPALSDHERQANRLIEQVLHLRGYELMQVSSSRALGFAELAPCGFTGVAVHVERHGVHICLSRQAVDLLDEPVTVDESVLQTLDELRDEHHAVDSDRLREALRSILGGMTQLLSRIDRRRSGDGRLKLVVGGELARSAAFQRAFLSRLELTGLPFETDGCRFIHDPLAVARGCLVHAELERRVNLDRSFETSAQAA